MHGACQQCLKYEKRQIKALRASQMPAPNYPVDILTGSLKSGANILWEDNQHPLKGIAEQQTKLKNIIALNKYKLGKNTKIIQ